MTPQERQDAALADLKSAGDALADIARMIGLSQLAAFDLETTGELRDYDRIVEIAAVKVRVGTSTDGELRYIRETYYALVNPEIAIADGATAVHGITDAMVADKTTFRTHAQSFMAFWHQVPMFGYNITGFDLDVLAREFRMANVPYVAPPIVIDPFRVFQVLNPRDLTAYVKHTLEEDLVNAHQGGADVRAVVRAFQADLRRNQAIPRTHEGIHALCNPPRPDYIDKSGKFRWRNGLAIIAFGKHMGTPLQRLDSGFLRWMLDPTRGFDADTLEIARNALRGEYPSPPAAVEP